MLGPSYIFLNVVLNIIFILEINIDLGSERLSEWQTKHLISWLSDSRIPTLMLPLEG